ncbi:uncharacterized protein METZ01_LOCUS160982 [marine metagenome]|uniref:Uncharacterized protein n=1 Tax=marine metagenome TaxID=408172 RepID=A0A382B2Z9_9ZZZZ
MIVSSLLLAVQMDMYFLMSNAIIIQIWQY